MTLDLLNSPAVREAVRAAKPDSIVHQATSLAGGGFSRTLDKGFTSTNQLRTTGMDTSSPQPARPGWGGLSPKASPLTGTPARAEWTEDHPLDPNPAPGSEQTNAAMAHVDKTVTESGGIALRSGGFSGSGSDAIVRPVRKRQFPIIDNGADMMSFVHLDDAATATVLTLEHGGSGTYNIVDDDPAPLREWVPNLAEALAAKPPRHVPAWIALVISGQGGVLMGERAASNAKAKQELGWIFAEQGYKETTVDQIEAEVGLSSGSGSLCKHFPSKEALLSLSTGVDSVLSDRTEFREAFEPASPAETETVQDQDALLRSVVQAGLHRMERDRHINRLLFRGLQDFAEPLARYWDGEILANHQAVSDLLRALSDRRVASEQDWLVLAAVLVRATAYHWLLTDLFGTHPSGVHEARFTAAIALVAVSLLNPNKR